MTVDSSEAKALEEEWRAYGALMALAALAGVTRPGSAGAQQHVFVYAERYLRTLKEKALEGRGPTELTRAITVELSDEAAAIFDSWPENERDRRVSNLIEAQPSVADIAALAMAVQSAAFKVLEGWVPAGAGRLDLPAEFEAAAVFPAPERWRGLVLFGLTLADMGRVLDLPTGPILQADAILAAILEELGEVKGAGKMRAAKVAPKWRRWLQEPAGPLAAAKNLVLEAAWARILADRERAAEEAERAREDAKHNRPALPRVVLVDQLFPAMTKQLQLLDDGKVRTDKGRILGAIVVDADTTLAVVRAGAALLGSEPGHEMIHELVHRAFDAHEAGASDPRRVGFVGGWGALAEAIGYGKGDHSILKLIAKAGQSIEWQTRHIGAGGLWTWTDKRGSRHGGAGEVAFVLGDALLPGLAAAMKREPLARTLSAREARRLVVEPRYKPPTSGVRPNERGAVWTLWRLFMLELTDKSVEYCGKGSIAVTVPRWRELHAQARLPWATHEKVLASWLEGESDKAPAFLAELEPGRFDLAPVHDLERVFLAEQGRRRLEGTTEGEKGPRAKASKKHK